MAKETGRPGVKVSLRLSAELHAQVAAIAKRERRTLAGLLKIWIEDCAAAAASPPSKRGH